MKKSILLCTLFLSVAVILPANANNSTSYAKSSTNLNDIILDTSSQSEPYSNNVMIADTSQNGETTLENKTNNKSEENEKKHFFQIFDLKGGVAKTEGQPEHTAVQDWLSGDHATGRWFGARPLLEDHGVKIDSSLLYSPFTMTRGGALGEPSTKGYSLYNLSVTVDTEKAGLWKGGTFYALYQRKTGYGLAGPTGAMGDYMYIDGWEGRQINQISEYWYQQKLFDNKVRLKVGKQDSNIDFAYLNSGMNFINLAFSINPTVPLPTYPDQTFGFMAEYNPKEWLSIRDGIYSKYSVPFNITEIEVKTKIKQMPGRYMLGGWELSDSSGFDVAAGMDSYGATTYNNYNRNCGAYFQFEQMVYKEKKNDDNDMQGLVVFGQAGVSPSDKNDMSKYIGGGLQYKGLIPKRDNDLIGLAVANGTFASRLGDVGTDYGSRCGSETVLEAFYRIQVTPWFYFQPDAQFIMNPGGTYDNSVAIGLRTAITF